MKIYIDLILIQDTFLMSVVLFAMSRVMEIKISIVRILVISLSSSLLSVLLLMYFPILYDNVGIKIGMTWGIVKYGFYPKEKIHLGKQCLLLFTLLLLLGGIQVFVGGNMLLAIGIFIVVVAVILQQKRKRKRQCLLESTTCQIQWQYRWKGIHRKSFSRYRTSCQNNLWRRGYFCERQFMGRGR